MSTAEQDWKEYEDCLSHNYTGLERFCERLIAEKASAEAQAVAWLAVAENGKWRQCFSTYGQARDYCSSPIPLYPHPASIDEPRGCPTPGACSCVRAQRDELVRRYVEPATGDRQEVIAALEREAYQMRLTEQTVLLRKAADMLRAGAVPSVDPLSILRDKVEHTDCVYRGDPWYEHDAYWMRERVLKYIDDLQAAPTPGKEKGND